MSPTRSYIIASLYNVNVRKLCLKRADRSSSDSQCDIQTKLIIYLW